MNIYHLLKLPATALLFALVLPSYCQKADDPFKDHKFELRAGINKSYYQSRDGDERDEGNPGIGFLIETGYTFMVGPLPMRLGGGIDNFSGDLLINDESSSPPENVSIDLNQTNFNLIFDPLVAQMHHFSINFGIGVGLRLFESTNSERTIYHFGYKPTPWVSPKSDKVDTSTDVIGFLRAAFSYDIPIKKKILISPRYTFSYLLPTVVNTYTLVTGQKHSLDIGVKIKL